MSRRLPDHELAIEPVEEDAGVRLVLTGELDLLSVPQLTTAVEERAQPGRRVVIDLTKLEFMDSSGLAAILNAHKAAEEGDWELAVASAPGPVDRIFDLTDTRDVLRFVS